MNDKTLLETGTVVAWSAWQHPVVQLVLAVFTTATAYVVGTINRIGLGFVHLLDKTDLFVVTATYASIAAVLISVFTRLWRVGDMERSFRLLRILSAISAGAIVLIAAVQFVRFDILASRPAFWTLVVGAVATGLAAWRILAKQPQKRAMVWAVLQAITISGAYLTANLFVDYARWAESDYPSTGSAVEVFRRQSLPRPRTACLFS